MKQGKINVNLILSTTIIGIIQKNYIVTVYIYNNINGLGSLPSTHKEDWNIVVNSETSDITVWNIGDFEPFYLSIHNNFKNNYRSFPPNIYG